MTERVLLASSASRTHSKTETVRQKAAVLIRDDSGVFSASPSPLTPSRQLSVFSPPPSEAMSMCAVAEDRSPETCSVQEESPLVFQTRNKDRTATEGDFGNAPPQQDILSQAFSCLAERGHQQWTTCGHTHCESISNQWQHLSSCSHRNSLLESCDRCTAFQKLVLLHAVRCASDECVVSLCPDAKRQLQSYAPPTPQNPPKTLLRSNSFTANSWTPVPPSLRMQHRQESFDDTLASPSTSYNYLQSWHELNQLGIGPLPVGLVMSYKLKAERIVAELEKEKSLEDKLLAASGTDPGSKPVDPVPASSHSGVFPGQLGVLSPIEEHPTPVASPCKMDEEGEGKRLSILHELDRAYLTPGMDGLYLHPRDYYLNEHLGTGGFGTCAAAKDRHTDELFVIKSNKFNDDSMIDSIRAEVDILSLLSNHENIIRFLGAMLEEDLKTGGRKCSLMLELAEHGSLADMLKDDDGRSEALPLDQSLYYLQQILQGVYYLHSNSVLHLDIKAENVLVLNGGKTVKLTDFGTAVHVEDVARRDIKPKGLTPHFTAPEIVRGYGPTFSSDVWSSVCVLIQLLTGNLPGCSQQVMTRENMMYMIGRYKDEHLEQLFPYLPDVEETDSNAAALIRDVLIDRPADRPSALQLLSYPSIVTACEYEQYFDMDFSQNQEYSVEEEGGAELKLNGADQNSNGTDVTLEAMESYVTPPTSLPLLITGEDDLDVSLDYPLQKKMSTDSGVSSRLDRMNSAASTVRMDSGDDSGIDTPCEQSTARQMNLKTVSTQEKILEESEREEEEENEARLPERALSQPEASLNIIAIHQYRQRSASAVCRRGTELPSNHSHFDNSESETFHSLPSNVDKGRLTEELERMGWVAGCPKQRPNSVPLMHSHSAPVVMSESEVARGRRRKEGSEEGWSKAPERLRRSSSEVYVERGPDIDTPEEKKKKRELELIAKQAAEKESQVAMATTPESRVATETAPPPGGHPPPHSHRAATTSNYCPPQGGGRSSDSQSNHGNGRHGYSRRPATAGGRLQSSSQHSSDNTGFVLETLV